MHTTIYPKYAYQAYKLISEARDGIQLSAFSDERVKEMLMEFTELFRIKNGTVYANKRNLSKGTKEILKGII